MTAEMTAAVVEPADRAEAKARKAATSPKIWMVFPRAMESRVKILGFIDLVLSINRGVFPGFNDRFEAQLILAAG